MAQWPSARFHATRNAGPFTLAVGQQRGQVPPPRWDAAAAAAGLPPTFYELYGAALRGAALEFTPA